MRVLAVDPGRGKCGIAVCHEEGILHREVIPRESLEERLRELATRFGVEVVVVGDQTGCREVTALAKRLGRPVVPVSERGTTLEARIRYLRDHPPRGLRRLLPAFLRVPDRPYDDYVAVLLAERFFAAGQRGRRKSV
ncbi:MAG: pre-16S rRNA-processing nuclease YqgF [Armatimonadetes bacterium]|nr:pre-16S rRNA-processing nuclease YqgF [Armatimonadota bacterium]MDW8154511.1 pre-16S rRNA-processing nuclease YqgF [Armatimonadota bacterium]